MSKMLKQLLNHCRHEARGMLGGWLLEVIRLAGAVDVSSTVPSTLPSNGISLDDEAARTSGIGERVCPAACKVITYCCVVLYKYKVLV